MPVREETLTVGCRLENLAAAAAAARGVAERRLSPADANEMEVAVTEICSNIIRHGHPHDPEHQFTMTLRGTARGVEVEIRDEGPAFSFEHRTMPRVDVALEDLPEGGFGMALVEAFMDVVEYSREGHVNVIRLVKKDKSA